MTVTDVADSVTVVACNFILSVWLSIWLLLQVVIVVVLLLIY